MPIIFNFIGIIFDIFYFSLQSQILFYMKTMKVSIPKLISYFIKGTLLITPFALTLYIISTLISWIDGLLGVAIPGVGVLIILISITVLGYFGSTIFFKSFLQSVEKFFIHIPFINIIYTSMKEVITTFVGDKKKFNKPVILLINKDTNMRKIGFITQENLKQWDLQDYVGVYVPFSYAFSGEFLLIAKERIKFLNVSSTDAMRIVISGGITGFNQNKKDHEETLYDVKI